MTPVANASPALRAGAAQAYRPPIASSYVMSAVAKALVLSPALWTPSEILPARQDRRQHKRQVAKEPQRGAMKQAFG